jgi:hypothetical protein
MVRRIRGPFPKLANLPALDVMTAPDLDILERQDLINSVLAEVGCNCSGHNQGQQRDPYFGADLSEIVARCSPHDVVGSDPSGNVIIRKVQVKLATLMAEVDGNNEVCAWIYEES